MAAAAAAASARLSAHLNVETREDTVHVQELMLEQIQSGKPPAGPDNFQEKDLEICSQVLEGKTQVLEG